MKFSIIIVAYMAEDKLLKCLKSLVDNPPKLREYSVKADAEIIIIDNSPNHLLGTEHNRFFTRMLQVYTSVIVEPHPENIGFAAGCNRGVELSGGDNLVFINPDTECYPEWSERMLAHMGPNIGAVGPISNFVAGFQNFYFHMKPAKDWATQARYAIKGLSKRGMDTKMLIGFFLMIRRTVWDEVGGMDPQFFLGCDDLDLSLRLREAGYQLIMATDVFIYHEGHASFYAAGSKSMELNKQSEKKMLAKLVAKYGEKIPTSTELWGCEILPTYVPKRQTLSVLMIARDEAKNLSRILPQLEFADEVIIVDTNPYQSQYSMDGWLGSYGNDMRAGRDVIYYTFPWTDSFAEARNFALSKCTGDWVLWLDADDRVTPESAAMIRAAMDNPGPMTQAKTCHFGMVIRDDGPDGFNYSYGQPRLFPRIPGLVWDRRVHESYMLAAERLGIQKVDTDIIINHTGYKDPAVMLKKHARNLRLEQMEADSPMKFYQMGKNLMGLSQYKESEECFRKVLETEWGAPLEKPFRDQVRTCMACLIIASGASLDDVDQYLTDNGKPDSIMIRAEAALRMEQIHKAELLYREYLAMEPVHDFYGSQRDYFTKIALGRLEAIRAGCEAVYGEDYAKG